MTLPDMWDKTNVLWNKMGFKTKFVIILISAIILFII